jgi:CHAT domain-containing protein
LLFTKICAMFLFTAFLMLLQGHGWLPLHALCWEGQPLIRRFAVSYAPNLSALLLPHGPSAQHRLLAVGIKDFAVPGGSLATIEGAEREVDAIAGVHVELGSVVDVLKVSAATKAWFLGSDPARRLAEYRWIHIATHGRDLPGDTPMESCLYLNDARLDGLEVAELRLDADLVVLSACHSGKRSIKSPGPTNEPSISPGALGASSAGLRTTTLRELDPVISGVVLTELPGDEIFGLQSALFLAGARRVLGALWPVDDRVAPAIMTSLHRRLAAGQKPKVALQRALIKYLESGDANERDLFFWSPFFLTGIARPVP